MIEFLLTLVILLTIVAGMAVGVLNGRKPITGSCGGLNNAGVGGACEICGGDTTKCEENATSSHAQGDSQFYDASR